MIYLLSYCVVIVSKGTIRMSQQDNAEMLLRPAVGTLMPPDAILLMAFLSCSSNMLQVVFELLFITVMTQTKHLNDYCLL